MHKVGIRGKLFFAFIIFTVACVLALWILEVWFLNDIYKWIKVKNIESASEKISEANTETMTKVAEHFAERENICCAVFNVIDNRLYPIADEHASGKCVVHNMNITEKTLLYAFTQANESRSFKSYLPADRIVELINRNKLNFDRFHQRNGNEYYYSESEENSYDCILYCGAFLDSNGNEYFCMLSTMIMPVDSTVQTIRIELIIVTAFMFLLAMIFSLFISKHITKPIIELNTASKTLPSGKFDATIAYGYREVDELSHTLSVAAEEIGKAEVLRKDILANVSHDLRTPLTLISGYSEVMRDLPGENTPENLQTVIDETNRLSALVNDILDLSKYEAGIEKINPVSINLTSLINSILIRYNKFIDKIGIDISFDFDAECYIKADRIKIGQVIYNLINNAINYCGDDKKIEVFQKIGDGKVRIEICDHGKGIPKDKIPYIWERYYKVDKNFRSQKVGTGLGLSIVKKALELHGAKYGVESEVGKGSNFWFELPIESDFSEDDE